MATREDLLALAGELQASCSVLRRIVGFYDTYEVAHSGDGQTTERAIVLSDVFVNFYTCAETAFLRISQFFENSLDTGKWHRDLLAKMTISIKGIRERVVSDETYRELLELLRFRHFKRYYFQFDYDWDRLELVRKKYLNARDRLIAELEHYVGYLEDLADASG